MPKIQTEAGMIEVSQEEFDRLNARRLPFTGGPRAEDVLAVGQSIPGVSFGATAARAVASNVDDVIKAAIRKGNIIPKAAPSPGVSSSMTEDLLKLAEKNPGDFARMAGNAAKAKGVSIPDDVLVLNRIDTENLADLARRAGVGAQPVVRSAGNIASRAVSGFSAIAGSKRVQTALFLGWAIWEIGLQPFIFKDVGEATIAEAQKFRVKAARQAFENGFLSEDELQSEMDASANFVSGLSGTNAPAVRSEVSAFWSEYNISQKTAAGTVNEEQVFQQTLIEERARKRARETLANEPSAPETLIERRRQIQDERAARQVEVTGLFKTPAVASREDAVLRKLGAESEQIDRELEAQGFPKSTPVPVVPLEERENISAEELSAGQSLPPALQGTTAREREALQSLAPQQFTEEELKRKQSRVR